MNEKARTPCDQAIARLWEYIDGELEAGRTQDVEAHLDACARCFPEYDFRRAYRAYLRQVATTKVPPELRRRIFQVLLAEGYTGADGAPRCSGTVDPLDEPAPEGQGAA